MLDLMFQMYTLYNVDDGALIGTDRTGKECVYLFRYRWSAEEKAKGFPGYEALPLNLQEAIEFVEDQRKQGLTHVCHQSDETETSVVPVDTWLELWKQTAGALKDDGARVRHRSGCMVVVASFLAIGSLYAAAVLVF